MRPMNRLHFKRLALKVPYLSLYAGADQLYTNELSVIFKGQDQVEPGTDIVQNSRCRRICESKPESPGSEKTRSF